MIDRKKKKGVEGIKKKKKEEKTVMKLKHDPTQWDYNIKSEQWLKFLRNDEVLYLLILTQPRPSLSFPGASSPEI